MVVQPPQAHNHKKKYNNYRKGWYFWFDDDNKMSYNYIFSIRFNNTTLHIAKKIRKVPERTHYILDKLSRQNIPN